LREIEEEEETAKKKSWKKKKIRSIFCSGGRENVRETKTYTGASPGIQKTPEPVP